MDSVTQHVYFLLKIITTVFYKLQASHCQFWTFIAFNRFIAAFTSSSVPYAVFPVSMWK